MAWARLKLKARCTLQRRNASFWPLSDHVTGEQDPKVCDLGYKTHARERLKVRRLDLIQELRKMLPESEVPVHHFSN